MNELQRQAYLDVMGVQVYFPRAVLSGAKPSPNYDFTPEQGLATEHRRIEQPGEVMGGPAAGSVRARVDQELITSLAQSRKKSDSEERAESRKRSISQGPSISSVHEADIPDLDTDGLRFTLHYIRINESLAVIDEVPHQLAKSGSTAAQKLLKSILAALGIDVGMTAFTFESFSWPIKAGLIMRNDPAEEARKALSGFLQMRHETDRFRNLLVFAGQVDSLLVQENAKSEIRDFEVKGFKTEAEKAAKEDSSAYYMTVTNSLHSLLVHSMLKRETWQQLQALRQRLSNSN